MIDSNDEPRDDESRGSFVGKDRACRVGEFFKGWRRKAGLVTLAMACVLAVGWSRSYLATDALNIPTREFTIQVLASVNGSLVWGGLDGRKSKFIPNIHVWDTREANGIHDTLILGQQQFRWLGFEVVDFNERYYGRKTQPNATVYHAYWIIRYWSLVPPLTLLSAWLILGKPRKAKSPSTHG